MRHCNSQCQIQFSFIILCEIHKLEEHPYLISAELSNCTKSGMIERSACPMPGKGSTLNKVHKACAHITFTLLTFASCDIWTVFLTTCFFLDFQILFQEGNIAQDQPRNICSLSNLILGISTFFLLNFFSHMATSHWILLPISPWCSPNLHLLLGDSLLHTCHMWQGHRR